MFRTWPRGLLTACSCVVLGVEKNPLVGSIVGLAVEISIKGNRQVSENEMRNRTSRNFFIVFLL